MELVTLIPGLLCLLAIKRWGTAAALQWVVLPTLLLLPTYFYFTMRPLPSLNFIDAALLPLGVGMAFLDLKRWRFTRTDLWVLLFLVSSTWAEHLLGRTTDAAFSLFESLTTGLIPYMAGKLLIEQTGSRVKITRMFVWLLAGSSFFSAYEYFFKSNPYTWLWSHFYPSQWAMWRTQYRWGFGRVAGPYSQSELAGMMVFTAWLLALWLGRQNYVELKAQPPVAALLKHGKRYAWALFVALFMTQARGPWIGAGLGLAVASIGRAKKPGRRAVIVLVCVFMIGLPTYLFGKDYLSGPRKDYGSEKETAQYRAELIDNYVPVAIKGGEWGWGSNFPRIGGQDSIDNAYLYFWIVQGYMGAAALILLIVDASGTLIVQAFRPQPVRERHFVLTLLGILVGIAFTITTVFLGNQSYELLFLVVGWSQAVKELPKYQIEVVRSPIRVYS